MKLFPNVQQSAELRTELAKSVSKGLRVDSLQHDLTEAAKIRISEIRRFYQVPKTSLADMLGTSYRQYLRFEEGMSVLPSWVLETLAMFYNLSVDFMSGLTDEPQTLYDGEYININGSTLPDVAGRTFN